MTGVSASGRSFDEMERAGLERADLAVTGDQAARHEDRHPGRGPRRRRRHADPMRDGRPSRSAAPSGRPWPSLERHEAGRPGYPVTAAASASRRATSARTAGATSVPSSSIARITSSCGMRADAELHQEPVVVEDLVLIQDLVDDVLRAADEVRAVQRRRSPS